MNIFDEQADNLVSALLSMKTPEEMKAFLTDLCTIQEIHALSQRYSVAQKLEEKLTYDVISQQTGASKATISRVSRALLWGENGYATALKRQNQADTTEVEDNVQ